MAAEMTLPFGEAAGDHASTVSTSCVSARQVSVSRYISGAPFDALRFDGTSRTMLAVNLEGCVGSVLLLTLQAPAPTACADSAATSASIVARSGSGMAAAVMAPPSLALLSTIAATVGSGCAASK